jgi:PTS system mannose-specific IIC component
MLYDVSLVALIGSILCLDRFLFQVMISRPIVVAPIIGFLMGDFYTGLIVGTFLELFWADCLPVGAYIPPNESIAAVIMTATAVLTGRTFHANQQELIAASALLTMPVGILGQRVDTLLMRSNDRLSQKALEVAKTGSDSWIRKGHVYSIFKALFAYFLMIILGTLIGMTVLTCLVPYFQAPVWKALQIIYYILPVIGIAVALRAIHVRGGIPVFSAIFLGILIIAQWLRG